MFYIFNLSTLMKK